MAAVTTKKPRRDLGGPAGREHPTPEKENEMLTPTISHDVPVIEYRRCRWELSCAFKSVSGFCPDHDRDDLYRRPVVELDNGKVVAVESLMKPSTRRAKR